MAIILSSFGCLNQNPPEVTVEPVQELPLRKLHNFWQEDKPLSSTDYMGAAFERHPGFIDGRRIRSEKKSVGISVFKSRKHAIQAMKLRQKTVASIITRGKDHELISGKWWYTKGTPKAVFVNYGNTIIEVSLYHQSYQDVETSLRNTASKIVQLIETKHVKAD